MSVGLGYLAAIVIIFALLAFPFTMVRTTLPLALTIS